MGKYLIKRVAHAIFVVLVVLFVVSIIIRFIPGDPVDVIMAGNPGITEEQKEELRDQLGLNDSVLVQFFGYAKGIVTRGDFGMSLRYRSPSRRIVFERLPATIELTLFSMLIAILIAVPFGILAALKQDTGVDYVASVLAVAGVSTPNFLLGILLVLLFAVQMRLLPASGRGYPIIISIKKLIVGEGFEALFDSLRHLALPSIALGMSVAGANMRVIRSAMLESIRTEYVRFAKAKGLPARIVFAKHAFRNALIPTVTVLGLQVGYLLGGSFVIENVFGWPGIGRLAVRSIFWRDYPLIQTIVLVAAVLFVSINLLVDIVYKLIDPRIRYG